MIVSWDIYNIHQDTCERNRTSVGIHPSTQKNDTRTVIRVAKALSTLFSRMSMKQLRRKLIASLLTAADTMSAFQLIPRPCQRCIRFRTSLVVHASAASHKPTLTLVTGNPNKLREIEKIFSAHEDIPFALQSRDLDLPEVQGEDPLAIARQKCEMATEQIRGPCLVEDTSLCFHALNGLPGPYIKWFLGKCGHDGLYKMLVGFDDYSAYAQTVLAWTAGPGLEIHTVNGRTEGVIVSPPRGPIDFGWDAIFEPTEGDGNTYAEMDMNSKNAISHRGKALAKFQDYVSKNPQTFDPRKR